MQINVNGHSTRLATGRVAFRPGLPGIIFVHGAGLDNTVWTLFNRYFAKKQFNSLAVDLPGHGRSDGAPLPSIEASADWLLDVIRALELEQVALVGHSMGALIALEAAQRAQVDISRLVLLGVAAPMLVAEPLLDAARANDHDAVDMIMLYAHAWRSQLGGNPTAGMHIMNSNMRLLERSLHKVLYTDLNACNNYAHGLSAAQNIKAPTNLLLGKQDRMTPLAQATDFINAFRHAQVEMLPNCGHMMLSEQPETVHRALARIFEE